MINIDLLMKQFTELLKDTFGNRVYFLGLQGSYGRCEAKCVEIGLFKHDK